MTRLPKPRCEKCGDEDTVLAVHSDDKYPPYRHCFLCGYEWYGECLRK
jgi:hypothetical protein